MAGQQLTTEMVETAHGEFGIVMMITDECDCQDSSKFSQGKKVGE